MEPKPPPWPEALPAPPRRPIGTAGRRVRLVQALGDAARRQRRDHRHELVEHVRIDAGFRGDMLGDLLDAGGTAENLAEQVAACAGRFGRLGGGGIGIGRDMGGIGQMAEDLGQTLGALQLILEPWARAGERALIAALACSGESRIARPGC